MTKSRLTDEWGFFTPVPDLVIEQMSVIGSDAVTLFMYLRYKTHREKKAAWPGYNRINDDVGWGRTRISNAIKDLEGAQLIEREKRYGRTTVYRLTRPPHLGGISSPEAGRLDADEADDKGLSSPEAGPEDSRNGTAVVPERDLTQDLSTQEASTYSRPKGARYNETRKEAQQIFVDLAKRQPLPPKHPNGPTWWWQPIMRMLDKVEWSVSRYRWGVKGALFKLTANGSGVIIKGPISIEGTFYDVIDEDSSSGNSSSSFLQELRGG